MKVGGVGELHAPFLVERPTRGSVWRCVAGNPGALGMTKVSAALPFSFRWPIEKTAVAPLRFAPVGLTIHL